MKIYEIITEAKKPSAPAPRNFVAKNAPKSGAGRHKDSNKKKDQEQGKVKHKNKVEEEKKGLYYYVNKRKKAGTSRSKNHPKAPSEQDWKNAAKTAKKETVEETASMASTSAASVNVGAVYLNKKGKTPKNKDGTAKNALDMDSNLLTGGSIRRR